jgi:hypothetical protein
MTDVPPPSPEPELGPLPPNPAPEVPPPVVGPPHAGPDRRDRLKGLSIVAVTFVVCLCISYWAEKKSQPEASEPPAPPTTQGVQGFPNAIDPLGTLAAAKGLTRRPMLRGFVAEGVKSDGTLDVSEGRGSLRYSFQSPAGHGPQPPRERGTLARQHYCGRQNVVVKKEGMAAEPDLAGAICSPHASDPLPDPRCTLAQVWKHALAKGAPSDKPARIEYYRAAAGPAWRFELAGTLYRFALYGDCQRELKGAESNGSVP